MGFGNKRILSFGLLICILFAFVACGSNRSPFSEATNTFYFRALLFTKKPNEVVIKQADAYFWEGRYYYVFDHSYLSSLTDGWIDLVMVHYGKSGYQQGLINPNWENWEGLEHKRDAYLEAVEKGEHKAFTQQEIQKYVDEYFAAQENSD